MFIVPGHPADWFPLEHDGMEIAPWREATLIHSHRIPQVHEGITMRPLRAGDRVTLATLSDETPVGPGRTMAVPFASSTVAEIAIHDSSHHIIRFTDTKDERT